MNRTNGRGGKLFAFCGFLDEYNNPYIFARENTRNKVGDLDSRCFVFCLPTWHHSNSQECSLKTNLLINYINVGPINEGDQSQFTPLFPAIFRTNQLKILISANLIMSISTKFADYSKNSTSPFKPDIASVYKRMQNQFKNFMFSSHIICSNTANLDLMTKISENSWISLNIAQKTWK